MTKYRAVGEKITRGEAYEAMYAEGATVISPNGYELFRARNGTLSYSSDNCRNFERAMLLRKDSYYLAEEIPDEPELEMPEILSIWRHKNTKTEYPVVGIKIKDAITPILISDTWFTLKDFHAKWEPVK